MRNLIINGFFGDALQKVIVNVCQKIPINHLSIIYYKKPIKNLAVQEVQFIKYHSLLPTSQSLYDPNNLIPLDQELITGMANSERIVLKMIDRLEVGRRYTHQERVDIYYYFMRYWNTVIEKHSVNLFIAANVPHEIYDYVVYGLCQLKKIPIIFLYHQSQIEDTALIMHDWKENCLKLESRFHELQHRYQRESDNAITLPDHLQYHYDAQVSNSDDAVPFYMKNKNDWRTTYKFIIDPVLNIYRVAVEDPKDFLLKCVNPVKWVKFLYYAFGPLRISYAITKSVRNLLLYSFYQRHTIYPDLGEKYIYVPLQYQPELSTSPLADAFVDQQLIIQMISKYLPNDVYVYVKEHPKQTSFCRTIKFYQDLLKTKNVVLVRKNSNSFNLIRHCLAVATSTGTPGWEALFREKPVLMFGSYIYQFADGVFRITTNDDCQRALDQILNHHTKPSLKNMKLYLKALGEVSIPAVIDPDYLRVSKLTEKENINNITQALLSEINRIAVQPSKR